MSEPATIAVYAVERLIGRGAMAAVWLCRDPHGEHVAVKWMDQGWPPLVRRFEQEIESLQRVRHPGAVRYRAHGAWEDRPYLVMDFVDGADLRVLGPKLHKRPPAERYARCRTIGRALCEVLDHVHGLGIVHRDVKPSNVLIDAAERVVLSDFGVAKDLAVEDHTMAGVVVGTVAYAAPEQLTGDRVDGRTDLFGLGATLYYLLTLHPPFEGAHRDPAARPVPPSHVDPACPADLESVVLRLMAPDPQGRFPDAASAAQALAEGGSGGVAIAGRQGALEAVARALALAEDGQLVVIRPTGPPGAGQAWLLDTARQAARRRDIEVTSIGAGITGPGVLLAFGQEPTPEGAIEIRVSLEPLGLGDVRRTVVGAAPLTANAALVAERLHRATGGLPDLLVSLLARHTRGQALVLPEDLTADTLVDDQLAGLDIDAAEVLGVLAFSDGPMDEDLLEEVAMVPVDEPLADLERRGVVRGVEGRWVFGAELFRDAARRLVADPEGLAARIADARKRRAPRTDCGMRTMAAMAAFEQGRLVEALDRARQAGQLALALGERTEACRALRLEGEVLLELGRFAETRRVLGDATALARAVGMDDQHRLSHVLRAIAALEERPGDRGAAAAAVDRLMPLVLGTSARKGDPVDALAYATWCRAAATLGDRAAWTRTDAEVRARLDGLTGADRARVLLGLAQAAAEAGVDATARDLAREAQRSGGPLVAWRAASLLAAMDGALPPAPGLLAQGLSEADLAGLTSSRVRIG